MKNILRPLPSIHSNPLPLYWIWRLLYLKNYMSIAHRLWTLANMLLVCFFGYLLKLGKSINATAGINLKMTIPSLEYWLVIYWYMMENNISRNILQKLTNMKNVLFLYRLRLLRIISRWLRTRRNWNLFQKLWRIINDSNICMD